MKRCAPFAEIALVAFIGCAVACEGTDADLGADAALMVEGAQFFRGLPTEDAAGPTIAAVRLGTNDARAGLVRKPIEGTLSATATAVALNLVGDRGYWIVRAREPQIDAPGLPSFFARLAFAHTLAAGEYDLEVRAVAAGGAIGPRTTSTLHVTGAPAPSGTLVFTLTWDTESDLDLHVVDPAGIEIFKGNHGSYSPPPPGEIAEPRAWEQGGILDTDSNAACVVDGLRRESVYWTAEPPKGRYVVRVDTYSLCQATSARWSVTASRAGVEVARAAGQSTEWDTRFAHDLGAGVVAIELDVP